MHYDWERGEVITADGTEIAHASRSWWRERAEVVIATQTWHFRADGTWGRPQLVAELDGVERMRDVSSGFWSTTHTVAAGDDTLTLSPAGLFTSRLVVRRGAEQVGEIARSGLLTNRPRLTTTTPWDAPLAVFVLWVGFVELTRRASDSSSGAVVT